MFNISTKVDFFNQRFSPNFFFTRPDFQKTLEAFQLAASEVTFDDSALKYDVKIPKIQLFETLRRLFFSLSETFFSLKKKVR